MGLPKLSQNRCSPSSLSSLAEPTLSASIKTFDDASENSKDLTPTVKSSLRPINSNDTAGIEKPTTADRLINELVRQNAEAIQLGRQVSRNHLISDSPSSSSSTTTFRRKKSQNRAGKTSQSRIPMRLDPVSRIKREETAPRYSTNQRNSKLCDITPSIEHILIPK